MPTPRTAYGIRLSPSLQQIPSHAFACAGVGGYGATQPQSGMRPPPASLSPALTLPRRGACGPPTVATANLQPPRTVCGSWAKPRHTPLMDITSTHRIWHWAPRHSWGQPHRARAHTPCAHRARAHTPRTRTHAAHAHTRHVRIAHAHTHRARTHTPRTRTHTAHAHTHCARAHTPRTHTHAMYAPRTRTRTPCSQRCSDRCPVVDVGCRARAAHRIAAWVRDALLLSEYRLDGTVPPSSRDIAGPLNRGQ